MWGFRVNRHAPDGIGVARPTGEEESDEMADECDDPEEMCECGGAREWHEGGEGECLHSECSCKRFRAAPPQRQSRERI